MWVKVRDWTGRVRLGAFRVRELGKSVNLGKEMGGGWLWHRWEDAKKKVSTGDWMAALLCSTCAVVITLCCVQDSCETMEMLPCFSLVMFIAPLCSL